MRDLKFVGRVVVARRQLPELVRELDRHLSGLRRDVVAGDFHAAIQVLHLMNAAGRNENNVAEHLNDRLRLHAHLPQVLAILSVQVAQLVVDWEFRDRRRFELQRLHVTVDLMSVRSIVQMPERADVLITFLLDSLHLIVDFVLDGFSQIPNQENGLFIHLKLQVNLRS